MNRQMMYIGLIIKYPTLKGFFRSCYQRNEDEKMYDFLFGIETESMVEFH